MRAAILSIGSELTSGQTVNTNAAYLARRLQEAGAACARHLAIPDEAPVIVGAVRETLASHHLVIVTGGLGPTFDDVTASALAQATNRPLRFVPEAARRVRLFYRAHHRRLNRLALRQALLPRGAEALPNPVGTAPGIWLTLNNGRTVVAMPGVPREMRAIFERSVLPRLRRMAGRSSIATRTLRTMGLVELQIQEALRTVRIPRAMQVGLYPNLMAVDVRLTVTGESLPAARRHLDRVERALRGRLGEAVYGRDEQRLEEVIGKTLTRKRLTLAVAESCTGGLVSDRLTDVPGSSRYLILSVVAYHNRAKEELLGVPKEMLRRDGAVSAQVARAMAEGVRRSAGTDVGLAVTGLAGPSGGSPQKPVGLVYLAVADRRQTAIARHQFHGDRLAIKAQAAQMALDVLRRSLAKRRAG